MITSIQGDKQHRFVTTIIILLLTMIGLTTTASAQYGTISYQGLLRNSGTPVNGNVNMDVTYYYAGSGTPLFTETFLSVTVTNGLFNIALGSTIEDLPALLDLTRPIELGIRVNQSDELSPRTQIHAVPYSMSAHSLDGLLASPTPENNRIFPMPLDAEGHISGALIHPFSINGLASTDGNINIAAGPNISLTRDLFNNRLLITGLGVSSIGVRDGIVGSNNNGVVTVGLDIGNLLGEWFANGTISGTKLSSTFPGEGVYIDAQGTLGLGVDHSQFDFVSNKLHLRTDAPVIGTNGLLQNLQVEGDVLVNSNVGSITVIMGQLYAMGGIDAQYQRITNLADPVSDDDAATASYVDQRILAASQLNGDILGTTADARINPASDGIGNRIIAAINAGSTTIDASRLAIDGAPPASDVLRGTSGKVILYIVTGGDQDQLELQMTNPAVKPTSIIVTGIVEDTHMESNKRYVSWVSDVTDGAFTLHLSRADASKMKGGNTHEGAAISYSVFY